MIRFQVFIIFSFLYIFQCTGQPSWTKASLYGRVESVTEQSFYLLGSGKNREIGNPLPSSHVRTEFDEYGYVKSITNLSDEGESIINLIYNYVNDKEIMIGYFDENGNLSGREDLKEIASGKVASDYVSSDGNIKMKGVKHFELGKLVMYEYDYFVNGELLQKVSITNDFDGIRSPVGMKLMINNKTIQNQEFRVVKTDKTGNWTERLTYDAPLKRDSEYIITTREIKYY